MCRDERLPPNRGVINEACTRLRMIIFQIYSDTNVSSLPASRYPAASVSGFLFQYLSSLSYVSFEQNAKPYRGLSRKYVLPEIELLDGVLEGVTLERLPPKLQDCSPRISPVRSSKLPYFTLRLLHCRAPTNHEGCERGRECRKGREGAQCMQT